MINSLPENNLRAYLRRCCTQGVRPVLARDIAFDLMIAGDDLTRAARNLREICHSQALKRWLGEFLNLGGNDNAPLTRMEE